MDFHQTETCSNGSETSLDSAAQGLTRSAVAGLPVGVSQALADPIVEALMAADRVDPHDLEDLLRRVITRLAQRDAEDKPAPLTEHEKPTASTGCAWLARGFVLAVAVIAGLSAAPRPATADETPATFIRALGDQAVSVIRSDMPFATKAAYFGQMVRQDFDLTGICSFVLGPYWRVASPMQRQEFCNGFADRLVRVYGQQLAQSGDGDFVVTGSRTGNWGVIVTSRIIPQQRVPIEVDWRLQVAGGAYKIEDVAIDGVSMELAQRSEIAGRIARGGGQVGTLLAAMGSEP